MTVPGREWADRIVRLRFAGAQARGGIALRALGCLAVAVLLNACVKPYNPFKIPSSELRDRVRTIALAPVAANPNLVDREYTRAQIEPILIERLRAGGFGVVLSEEMERFWRRAANDVGAVFDPVSGEVDEERFEVVEAAVYRDLRAEHKADAVLYVRITAVELFLTGSTVDYCGVTGDKVYWPGSGIPLLEHTTIVYALCLNTELHDLEGRNLYGIRHGIETVETYFRQTRAVRPLEHRLRDRERLAQAVEATLGPLAGAGR